MWSVVIDHDWRLRLPHVCTLVINVLFSIYLYMCRLPDSFEPLMCATPILFTTSFGVCTWKEIVALSELQNPLLCNTFHLFSQWSDSSDIFLFHFAACYRLDSGQPFLAFLVNELFMSYKIQVSTLSVIMSKKITYLESCVEFWSTSS